MNSSEGEVPKDDNWQNKEFYDEDDYEVEEVDPNEPEESGKDEPASETSVRLQKALAAAGIASRRACEDLIVRGQVKVNGKLVTELGSRVNPAVDFVTVRGVPVQFDTSRVYLALNKPAGIISTMADDEGRPDLSSFVIDFDRVFNIGRLDSETTGLLLLTNDGELANKLAHPSFGVEKTYVARVAGEVVAADMQKLIDGFELEDGFINADRARIIDVKRGEALIEIVLHSGRNRIVRRMLDHIGRPVLGLVRKQFGPIHLGTLKSGHIRNLSKVEIGALLKAAEGKQDRAPRPPKSRSAASGNSSARSAQRRN
jgi:pseudouridine synthase